MYPYTLSNGAILSIVIASHPGPNAQRGNVSGHNKRHTLALAQLIYLIPRLLAGDIVNRCIGHLAMLGSRTGL
jgi:hypothetical protein